MASFKCEHDDDSDINSSYEDERRSCDSEKGIHENDNKIANRRSDISCSIGSDVAQHGAYLKFVYALISKDWKYVAVLIRQARKGPISNVYNLAVNSMGDLGIFFLYRPYLV